MRLMESIDGPGAGLRPGRPRRLACTPGLVAGCVERIPPNPQRGPRAGQPNPPAALDAPRNERGDDGSPARPVRTEAGPGPVDRFHETH